jgi:hypothetical protein
MYQPNNAHRLYPQITFTTRTLSSPLTMAPRKSSSPRKKSSPRKPTNDCNVGVAFYTVPQFPLQWVLVLSESEKFEGDVWCTTINETTNGPGASWTHLDWSPSGLLHPIGFFSGVISIAQSSKSISTLQDLLPLERIVSEVLPQSSTWEHIGRDSSKYVSLVLQHLCDGRFISVPGTNTAILPDLIRGRFQNLQAAQRPGSGSYPVVPLKTGEITYALMNPI